MHWGSRTGLPLHQIPRLLSRPLKLTTTSCNIILPNQLTFSLCNSIATVNLGLYGGGSGTSASALMLAGIITLLNDARFQAGKGPLGFINPLIYEYGPTDFGNITKGVSYGCGARDEPGEPPNLPLMMGNCTTGWDPVTGMGTPDFEKLREIVLGL
jgi:tripeptidyl-peptidase-1